MPACYSGLFTSGVLMRPAKSEAGVSRGERATATITERGVAGFDPRIWLLALGTFAIGTDAFVVAGILPRIAADLGIRIEVAGQVVSAYALTYAIGSPLLAGLVGRWPRERIVPPALIAFAVANALCAVAPSYAALIAARIMAGVCAALYTPTAYALAAGLARAERRGSALAAVALGLTASTVLGVPLGAWLGYHLGWHATFWLVAGLSIVAATTLVTLGLPATAPNEQSPGSSLAARLAPLARPRVLLVLLPTLLWSTGNYTVYTYIALFLGRHYDVETITLMLLVFGLGGLAGSQLGGRLADRFGPFRPIVVCNVISVANYALLGASTATLPGAALALFLWSLTGWATFAPQQSRLIALEPANPAVVLALNSSTIYLGSAAGAALGALLLGVIPVVELPFASAALVLGGFIALFASRSAADRH
jgi:DHA1 family inner membrane transport protein